MALSSVCNEAANDNFCDGWTCELYGFVPPFPHVPIDGNESSGYPAGVLKPATGPDTLIAGYDLSQLVVWGNWVRLRGLRRLEGFNGRRRLQL